MKIILVALGLAVVSFQAFAADCPVQFGNEDYLDKVSNAINAAESCEQGAAVAEACALGASGDVVTVPVAEQKCAQDFATKLSDADKNIYSSLQAKCDEKYQDMQGTMYLSFNAFCHLRVARLYSQLYSPAE